MAQESGRAEAGGLPFPDTLWSQVLALREDSPERAREALAKLCRDYWHPLYVFVRRRGYTREDAQDLTQSFFEFVISHDALLRVEPERGKFRAFLLACCQHFLAKEWEKWRALKRGSAHIILSLEEMTASSELPELCPDTTTPELVYDRVWAIALINRGIEQLKAEYKRAAKVTHFEVLRGFLPGAEQLMTHTQAAATLGLSRGAFDVALHRFKNRFGTVASEGDIDEELQYLITVWLGTGAAT